MLKADPATIARWFDAHGRALVLYARQLLVGDMASAEDVVQDLFVKLLAQAGDGGIPSPPSPAAWLHKCLHHACLDLHRSRRRRRDRERRAAGDRPAWFEPHPDTLIDARHAQDAMESLPDAVRQVIALRIWSGLTLAEVADVIGLPISSVHDQYRRALSQVRSAIEARAAAARSRHE